MEVHALTDSVDPPDSYRDHRGRKNGLIISGSCLSGYNFSSNPCLIYSSFSCWRYLCWPFAWLAGTGVYR